MQKQRKLNRYERGLIEALEAMQEYMHLPESKVTEGQELNLRRQVSDAIVNAKFGIDKTPYIETEEDSE